MSRLGAKGAAAPFVKALENKKSSQIALLLKSYKGAGKSYRFFPQRYKNCKDFTGKVPGFADSGLFFTLRAVIIILEASWMMPGI
ncbi:MAG: hypothetical protein LBK05_03450 [Treponema sp.]|jgi:hypothetical protein|nr:hypothetical protein [Treponema sp.]